MKTTIYELLGMVKDGKAPKKIAYDKYVYELNEDLKSYEREIDPLITLNWDYIVMKGLNDEVEILGEEKKIPEKLKLSSHWNGTFEQEQKYRNKRDDEIAFKINEIIDCLDYLKSKGDE